MRARTAIAAAAITATITGAGGAWAAGQITGGQIKNGSITGSDVKNHSITKRDLRGNFRGPRGRRGARGPAGPTQTTRIVGATTHGVIAPGDINFVTVDCPAGTTTISGGYVDISGSSQVYSNTDHNIGVGWSVGVDNSDDSLAAEVDAYVKCAASGRAIVASRGAAQQELVRLARRDAARERAAK